ncbi:type IV pilus twitching motility protein PilT [Acidiphilium sp. C61]|uniref:type IV pilus twitching motility protein PilT n=1 Tax=Acidiphilium sp. C61 TaxID=1671485 RepID=UPI00157BA170|nr:ATPase, T2SS/T4P/T4SS family [Acidiphilium sp. C61]
MAIDYWTFIHRFCILGEMNQIDTQQQIPIASSTEWVPGLQFRVSGRLTIDEFDMIAQSAARADVSDISVQVGEPVWFERHGRWHRVTHRAVTVNEVNELIRVMYGDRSGPGQVNQQGRPLDFAYVASRQCEADRPLRMRVNATAGRNPDSAGKSISDGVQLSLRVLPGSPPRLTDMNVEPTIIEQFGKLSGLMLVTGPTGSGKTTLMGAGIRHIGENPENSVKIIEYSAPIELVYDDLVFPNSPVHQVEVGRDIRLRAEEGGSRLIWAASVANAMRRKPGLIVIGEARDGPTIEGLVTAVTTGHPCISTMHTIGVSETVRRAIMAISPDQRAGIGVDLIDVARCFITQLLVPKIGGGRIAVREYLVFDAALRRRIIEAPMEQWTVMIQEIMARGEAECCRMIDSARKAFEAGHIAEEDYEKLALRQRQVERQSAQNVIDPNGRAVSMGGAPVVAGGFDPELDQQVAEVSNVA